MNMFELLKMMAEADVEFVLVGGLAVALHGYQRLTMDVDVVLAMDEGNLHKFISAAKANKMKPTIPVALDSLARPELIEQWHREKGMLAFSLRGAETMATALDVLVKPVVPFADLRRDAVMTAIGDIRVPVASIEHLVAMKSGTGRGKDAVDIEELRKIQARQ